MKSNLPSSTDLLVTAAPIDESGLAALQRVHGSLNARSRRPTFDGIYLTWPELARAPADCGPVPYAYHRQFAPSGRFELSPIAWVTLARHGVRDEPAALVRWTYQNL